MKVSLQGGRNVGLGILVSILTAANVKEVTAAEAEELETMVNNSTPPREHLPAPTREQDTTKVDHVNIADNYDWILQSLPAPENGQGQNTGVAVYDLNFDGHMDVLFSAGRHSVDQSYALINLGYNEDDGTIRFSEAIPIGEEGGYYQVDASSLSSLEDGHVAVLLAGGTCHGDSCPIKTQPAVVLDVHVGGCSVEEPDQPCESSYTEIWRDANPQNDRNGAFAPTLGDGTDPAIVLVGTGCISIFEPDGVGAYPTGDEGPTFSITPEEKVANAEENNIKRAAALAVGYIGDRPGLIAGVRTSSPPAPLIAVYKTRLGTYKWFDFGTGPQDELPYDRYEGNGLASVDTTGLALGDLNGDGTMDIVETNYVDSRQMAGFFMLAGHSTSIPHFYYLVDSRDYRASSPSLIRTANDKIPPNPLFNSPGPGRSVDIGQIFDDSPLPDVATGLQDGAIRLFANLGVHERTGEFLGFEDRGLVRVQSGCTIRDIQVASLAPCTTSLVIAVTCGTGRDNGKNRILTSPSAWTCPQAADADAEPEDVTPLCSLFGNLRGCGGN